MPAKQLLFNEEAQRGEIPPTHVGLLYESLLSAETDTLRVRLSLEGAEPEDVIGGAGGETEGEFEILYVASREQEERILGCEACSSEAEIPFDWVLDEVTGYDGSEVDYVLSEAGWCPKCLGAVSEETLVEW